MPLPDEDSTGVARPSLIELALEQGSRTESTRRLAISNGHHTDVSKFGRSTIRMVDVHIPHLTDVLIDLIVKLSPSIVASGSSVV